MDPADQESIIRAVREGITEHERRVPHSGIGPNEAAQYVSDFQSLLRMQDKLEDLIDGPEIYGLHGSLGRDREKSLVTRLERLEGLTGGLKRLEGVVRTLEKSISDIRIKTPASIWIALVTAGGGVVVAMVQTFAR